VDVFTGEGNVHRSGQSRVGSVATSEEYQSVDLVTDDVTMTSRGRGGTVSDVSSNQLHNNDNETVNQSIPSSVTPLNYRALL